MESINSFRLDAFAAVAAESSFTRAAKRIGITQSAVSQRVTKLEDDLGVTLFVRDSDRVRLTSEGSLLLRYARASQELQEELLAPLVDPDADPGALRGVVRIGGYSSVTRSVVLPALTPVIRRSPKLIVHTFSRELRELPLLLRNGEADFVVLDRELLDPGFTNIHLGEEVNVLVEPTAELIRPNCFLDHDPDDTTTERFFRLNNRDFDEQERSFMDDIYGILDGVAAGWGRAVASKHLVDSVPGLRAVPGLMPLITPVVLVMRKSRFTSQLRTEVVTALTTGCAKRLSSGGS